MKIKSIAECSFCNTFDFFALPFVIKIFVLSIFEWPFYTGFTVVWIIKLGDSLSNVISISQGLAI